MGLRWFLSGAGVRVSAGSSLGSCHEAKNERKVRCLYGVSGGVSTLGVFKQLTSSF